jgi:hypothetical protein
MKIRDIGLTLDNIGDWRKLRQLEQRLEVAASLGFRLLEAIDHPNVGMAMDVGHLYIAARDMGFDYLEGISQAAPWIRHVHISDNFGNLDQGFDIERVTGGRLGRRISICRPVGEVFPISTCLPVGLSTRET